MAHRYFELPEGISAEQISELIYKICIPKGVELTSKYAFGWISKPGLPDLIEIDEEQTLPVYVNGNFDSVINALNDILEPILYPEEGVQMVEYIRTTDRFSMINLIPQRLVERDESWIYLAGYRPPKSISPI